MAAFLMSRALDRVIFFCREIEPAAEKPENNLAFYLALPRGKQRISADSDGQNAVKFHRDSKDAKSIPDKQIPAISGQKQRMPKVGIEPTPCCQDGILNPARLPVPPLRRHLVK
jgi:hypothetical protein